MGRNHSRLRPFVKLLRVQTASVLYSWLSQSPQWCRSHRAVICGGTV